MAKHEDWTSSAVKPEYSTGGNINQTPKFESQVPSSKKGRPKKGDTVNDDFKVKENNSSTSMYQGWSVQGIRRFNELYDMVFRERASSLGSEFVEAYLQHCIDCRNETKKRIN